MADELPNLKVRTVRERWEELLLDELGISEEMKRFRTAFREYAKINSRRFPTLPEILWILYQLGWRPHAQKSDPRTDPAGTQEEG